MRQNKTSPNFSSFWQALFVCLLLYTVFFVLNKSYISAFEDLHIEYLLSGGYGQPPTLELHYQWGWHPFVFYPVYILYGWAPEINWYGLFLLALQFLAHLVLVKTLIVHLGFKRAFPLYLVFFLIFGFPLLQKLEISTTSTLLALSACTSLLMKLKDYTENRSLPFIKKNIFLLILLLLAVQTRLHTAFLCAALFSVAAIIIVRREQWKIFFLFMLITFSTALLLFQVQKLIYQQNDQYEYWKDKTDLYFSLTNRPNQPIVVVDSIQKMESSFILSHFWIDSSLLTAQKIKPYVRPIGFQSLGRISQNREFGYWAFQNNRIILLLMLVLIAASLLLGGYKMLTKSILLTMLGIVAYCCILILFKMREHIILSISSFLFLSIVVLAGREISKKDKFLAYLLFLSFFTIGLWRVTQQLKAKIQLDKNINATYNMVTEFALYPEILFIHPSNEGWFGLNAFDSPNRFPLKNVITRELITTGKSKPIFKRFGIDHLADHLLDNDKIVLLGVNQPDWQHYFEWKRQKQIKVVPSITIRTIPGFQIKTIQ